MTTQSNSYQDIIVPPIYRERREQKHDENIHLREALIRAQRERDRLDQENASYRRLIFTLLTQLGGSVNITHDTLLVVPLHGVISTRFDARDRSVQIWIE